MEMNNQSSLSAQVLAMQTRHRQLDEEIARLQDNAYIDQLQVQRLKRQKLRLKESIGQLKNRLIPNLDA